MKGNVSIFILAIAIIAIAVMFIMNIQPGNKLYENQMYGFKTEYPGTWQELGGSDPKIVTFIDQNSADFKTNTDIYLHKAKTCPELGLNLTANDEFIGKENITLAGQPAQMLNTKTTINGFIYYQQWICLQNMGNAFVIVNTAKDISTQQKNFNIIENNFAFTIQAPSGFGGIGGILSSLKQAYQNNTPITKTFDWKVGNTTYTLSAIFDKNSIRIDTGLAGLTMNFGNFSFLTEDPMLDPKIIIQTSKMTDTEIQVTYESNLGYTKQKITKTYDTATGLPTSIRVESSAGNFELKFK